MRSVLFLIVVCRLCAAQNEGPAITGAVVGGGSSAPAFVSQCSAAAPTPTGLATCTLNSTGATLLWIGSQGGNNPANCIIGGSPAETWTQSDFDQTSPSPMSQSWYVYAPATSASQTVSMTDDGSFSCLRPALTVIAFSGTFTAHKDKFSTNDNGTGGSLISLTTGSTGVLTGTPQEVCFSTLSVNGNPVSGITIDSSFHTPVFSVNYNTSQWEASSYLIPGTSAAINATWSWTTVANAATVIGCYK